MDPKYDEGSPSRKTVNSFKVVMEQDAEARVCCCEDKDQHDQQNIGHYQGCKSILIWCMNVSPGRDCNVEDEPNDGGCSATTMGTAIMEDPR